MTKRRELLGAKQIADYYNISVRAFWYQHAVDPFPIRRLRPRGKIWAYVSDLEKYRERKLRIAISLSDFTPTKRQKKFLSAICVGVKR